MWRFLVSSVGPSEAEDCFQETFISALRAYPAPAGGLEPARVGADDRPPQGDRLPPRPRPPGAAGVGSCESSTRRAGATAPSPRDAELWGAVRELPPRQRSAVVLRFLADLAHREIAAAIGCSEEAARRSLHEGLTKLREEVVSMSAHDRRRDRARPARGPPARSEPKSRSGRGRRRAPAARGRRARASRTSSTRPVDSPFGTLHAARHPARARAPGLPRGGRARAMLEELSRRTLAAGRAQPASRWTRSARELDEYFDGRRRASSSSSTGALIGPFARRVLTPHRGDPLRRRTRATARSPPKPAAPAGRARRATRWARTRSRS